MGMRLCTKCKRESPATSEYFYRDKSARDGLRGVCKACTKQYQQSEKGREAFRRSGAKYRASENGVTVNRTNREKYYSTVNGCLHSKYDCMLRRCNEPSAVNYKDYGGRGIKVCFESVNEFVNYVVNILQVDPHGLQIDRIDNDGNYERGNIRFVTPKVNSNNRR